MRETYQPPTTSRAGPPHDRTPPSFPHSPVIPAKAGILHPAASNSQRDGPPLTVDRNRHNTTESNEPQRKLVRAREATAFRFLSPNMDRIRRIPWICRLRSLMPINQTELRRPRTRPPLPAAR